MRFTCLFFRSAWYVGDAGSITFGFSVMRMYLYGLLYCELPCNSGMASAFSPAMQ